MLKKLSLVAKLLLGIALVTVLSLGVSVWMITKKNTSTIEARVYGEAEQLGYRYAGTVEQQLNDGLELSRYIAATMLSVRESGHVSRDHVNVLLRTLLEQNSQYIGVWVGMEPNALDGRDAEFAGKPGSDTTGRFLSYWNRGSGQAALESLTGYDDPGSSGQYYQKPKRTLREAIIEPYSYSVGGRDVLMMSLAVPIIEQGRVIGVAGVDLSTEGIWSRLKDVKVLETGSILLISNEGLWAGYPKPEYLGKPIETTNPRLEAIKPAIHEGRFAEQLSFSASLQTEVKQLYIPIQIGNTGTPWSLLVNLPLDKIVAPIVELRNFTAVGGIVLLALLMISLWIMTRQVIGQPLKRSTAIVSALAAGNLQVQVTDVDRGDEIGTVNMALQVFKDNMIRNRDMEREARETEIRVAADRKASMIRLADNFEASVKGIVETVASAATEMQSTASVMANTASTTSQQATVVAAASEEASANVQTVAAATEELSASISEIGRQINSSSRIANQAVTEAERTNETMTALVHAADQIGQVVDLINSIAGQTNLLALNATIEAARAGDAGKGFAVVAHEVKSLATQTAKATEEIQAKVKEIQGATSGAQGAIIGIGRIIGQMNEITTTIAAAIDEQGAVTRDISSNVSQAAQGTEEVSANITGVTQAAGETGAAASQVLGASEGLAREAERLRGEVTSFIATVRAS
jgi:methyl-accepting chemotaxis protein